MHPCLTMQEVEGILCSDLYRAEQCFDEVKTRLLTQVTDGASLLQARSYLRAIEDILADQHEARRARTSRRHIDRPFSLGYGAAI